MIGILVPVGMGLLLLGILLYWFLHGEDSASCRLDYSEAHAALESLHSGFATPDLLDRIANEPDMVFVRSEGNRNLMALFYYERRTVTILWLRRVRQQVKRLMSFHVKLARSSAKLGPVVELRLAYQYLVFLSIYNVLLAMVWLRGPFRTRKVAGLVSTALREFCDTSQQALGIARSWQVASPQGSETESR